MDSSFLVVDDPWIHCCRCFYISPDPGNLGRPRRPTRPDHFRNAGLSDLDVTSGKISSGYQQRSITTVRCWILLR